MLIFNQSYQNKMINILILGLVAIFQEAAFTWSSRSRNSGDHKHHFLAVCASTAMYFLMQVFLMKSIWESLNNQNIFYILATGVVFTICSAVGSSYAMKFLLKLETGLKRVGANPNVKTGSDKKPTTKKAVSKTKNEKQSVDKNTNTQVKNVVTKKPNNQSSGGVGDYSDEELESGINTLLAMGATPQNNKLLTLMQKEYEKRGHKN